MQVSRDNPLPLYHQLIELFRREIDEGGWSVGAVIPPETELAERLGVSRATVRQALLELVHSGHLHRVQGKGTIVTRPEERKVEPIGALTSFSENMRAAGITPTRLTLRAQWRRPEGGRLQGADRAFYVERLLIADQIPLGIQRAWYPERLVVRAEAMFTKASLDRNSIYEILQQRCGVVLDHAEETIDVRMPSDADAELLAVAPDQPIMLIHRDTFDPDERLVESVELFYRSDRYRYRVFLARTGGER